MDRVLLHENREIFRGRKKKRVRMKEESKEREELTKDKTRKELLEKQYKSSW